MATEAVDAQHDVCRPSRSRRRALGWVCAFAASVASAAETPGYAGQRLIDAIADLESRMEASLIGRNVTLERSNSRPKAYRFMVGDNCEIRLH